MAEVFVGPVAQGYASGEVTVLLASPRSFCAGVERAIETVKRVLDVAEGPVYVRKQIVHNTVVVAELRDRGAVFVEDLDEIPDPPPPGAVVVFSAHGVSPAVRAGADERGLQVVDATCPLVAKVHAEAARFAARGDTVVFIGHAGHEETEGTLGVAPRSTLLVQTPADVAALNLPEGTQLSYLTQTTLALDETADVIDALRARFPTLGQPPSEDICYATTNRQRALRTYFHEVGPSISTNVHVLGALKQAGYDKCHPRVRKVLEFIRSSKEPGRFCWRDKWHRSAYYTTAHLICAASNYDDALCSDAIGWILNTQRPDGSWGFFDGQATAEETAYCIQALAHWQRHSGTSLSAQISRAGGWLSQHCEPPYAPLWIAKTLYCSATVVKAAILSALRLVDESNQ